MVIHPFCRGAGYRGVLRKSDLETARCLSPITPRPVACGLGAALVPGDARFDAGRFLMPPAIPPCSRSLSVPIPPFSLLQPSQSRCNASALIGFDCVRSPDIVLYRIQTPAAKISVQGHGRKRHENLLSIFTRLDDLWPSVVGTGLPSPGSYPLTQLPTPGSVSTSGSVGLRSTPTQSR